MTEEPKGERLRDEQRDRELAERKAAEVALAEEETAQHKRRAEKAAYLREKLDERVDSERDGG